MHFLIVIADFYEDIAAELLNGAVAELEKEKISYHKITVMGAFDIPPVISFACDNGAYDGYIALGCVIRGETIHHEVIAHESARAISELAINMNLAIGNGILNVENKKQAIVRAAVKTGNKGGFAAKAAIKLARIRDKFQEMLIE